MDYSTLGPPPLADAMDLPPIRFATWSIVSDTNHAGEATLTFKCQSHQDGHCYVLVVGACPRTGLVLRATLMEPYASPQNIHPKWIPGGMRDLIATRVLEVFQGAYFEVFPA